MIGKRSTMAAKAKFVRENKRLSEVLDGLQISRDAMQLVLTLRNREYAPRVQEEIERSGSLENRNV
jgi:hypothetical protein